MYEVEKMREYIKKLQEANRAYYQESREIMSNFEYDALYDRLVKLETETGIVLAGSPTHQVGYEVVSKLPKERHEKPMLSLDKTKDREALSKWVGSHKSLLSWKMDGLTVVLTYQNGELVKAVTRGNGEVGEIITNNAKTFRNIPLHIPFKGDLVLRGEAVISYDDFKRINEAIPEMDAKYKNPRNLCSGTVRQLNSAITAERNVNFLAFFLVKADGAGRDTEPDFHNSRIEQFNWLNMQGFSVVPNRIVREENLLDEMKEFEKRISEYAYPVDGLVVLYDDIAYGDSLGRTAKFPRNSIAFKWGDEVQETTLRKIEWSPSRTGLINPVAVFDPVELEGTTVSRASVHNVSIVKKLELGIGDTIQVYKANMIIPQVAENLTRKGKVEIPEHCPVCGGRTEIRQTNDTETLYCINPNCLAKWVKAFSQMVSREALNVEGLSEATLEKFIDKGFIHEQADVFKLWQHKAEIVDMEGFGEKSFEKLQEGVERARNTTLPRVLYSLGIPNVGLSGAKLICKHFNDDPAAVIEATVDELSEIEGVGDVIAANLVTHFHKAGKREAFEHLLAELTLEKEQTAEAQDLAGKVFVVTGSLQHFSNRNELKELIERRGGKVTGSVTNKTDYLLNNDAASSSSKNKKAKELGIPILSEEEFLNL